MRFGIRRVSIATGCTGMTSRVSGMRMPEDALSQERLLRQREQLIRQELEEQLAQASQAWIQAQQELEQEAQARIQAQQELEQEARSRRSLLLRQLTRKVGSIDDRTLDLIDSLSTDQLESLGEDLLDFRAIADLTTWLERWE
jgi:hypothetical protein